MRLPRIPFPVLDLGLAWNDIKEDKAAGLVLQQNRITRVHYRIIDRSGSVSWGRAWGTQGSMESEFFRLLEEKEKALAREAAAAAGANI
jgi:hypothetical protein